MSTTQPPRIILSNPAFNGKQESKHSVFTVSDGTTNLQQKRTQKRHPFEHLLAGGMAGFVEASICQPLDTIKTRMQLRRSAADISTLSGLRKHQPPKALGLLATAQRIARKEGFLSLYKGLSAVYTGIVPKMSIRFLSFDIYRDTLHKVMVNDTKGEVKIGSGVTFFAGLACGLTEAILITTPSEVCKIRLQAQYHSMADPVEMATRKYRNVIQTVLLVAREEGIGALYKGIVPTMMRQGCNQAANFTCYNYLKIKWMERNEGSDLMSWQHLVLGCASGILGPTISNPVDVVKTRLQRQVIILNQTPKYASTFQACSLIAKEEGIRALYKGFTPRMFRIVPGQGITFMVYEAVSLELRKR